MKIEERTKKDRETELTESVDKLFPSVCFTKDPSKQRFSSDFLRYLSG